MHNIAAVLTAQRASGKQLTFLDKKIEELAKIRT